jgi:hypothetical protein
VSNTNFPIQTTSALAITDASAQLWSPALADWTGGLRLNHRILNRDIASIGQVRGYPERFSYWQAALGLKRTLALNPGLIISGEGWLGGGPAGTLALNLPTADATQLTLGSSKLAEIALQLGSPALTPGQAGWSWQARVDYQWQTIAAGPAKALVRNGIPVGGAAQPAVRQQALGVSAGANYRF